MSPTRSVGRRHKPFEALRCAPRHVIARGWLARARRSGTGVGCPTGWAVGLVLLLTSYTAAAQVTLAWDASVSMVDGYWLYQPCQWHLYRPPRCGDGYHLHYHWAGERPDVLLCPDRL
jgi:hypothetical protein